MEKVTIEEITLRGLTVRTSNEREMTGSGSIGPLWQKFYSSFTESTMPAVGYGVYHNYESDHTGDFDLTVAADLEDLEGSEIVTIPAGTYLKFSVSGECPAAVISEWMKIWAYFETADAPKRTYRSDFEKYLSMTEAEIYIGVQE